MIMWQRGKQWPVAMAPWRCRSASDWCHWPDSLHSWCSSDWSQCLCQNVDLEMIPAGQENNTKGKMYCLFVFELVTFLTWKDWTFQKNRKLIYSTTNPTHIFIEWKSNSSPTLRHCHSCHSLGPNLGKSTIKLPPPQLLAITQFQTLVAPGDCGVWGACQHFACLPEIFFG